MADKKLFKKLTEKMEIDRILNKTVTEAEIREAEKRVIFEDATSELLEKLSLKSEEDAE